MRISEGERSAIVGAVQRILPTAKVYLYGSRTDDTKKGGDIDLLIVLPHLEGGKRFELKLRLHLELEKDLGERRIDLTLADLQELTDDPFLIRIWPHAMALGSEE